MGKGCESGRNTADFGQLEAGEMVVSMGPGVQYHYQNGSEGDCMSKEHEAMAASTAEIDLPVPAENYQTTSIHPTSHPRAAL